VYTNLLIFCSVLRCRKGLHRNGEKSHVKLFTYSVWSGLYVVYSLLRWLQRSVWSADSTEHNHTD